MTPAEGHQHTWRTGMHLDGCHFYEWHASCACGAHRVTHDERSVGDDPNSAVWMDQDEVSEPCARCQQLLAGAEPQHEDTIQERVA